MLILLRICEPRWIRIDFQLSAGSSPFPDPRLNTQDVLGPVLSSPKQTGRNMSLSNDGASSKASEDYKVEVSAEDRLEEEEVETPEEIQPAQNEMENAPANAQPAVNDDDAIEILENMQIRILTEIYDELMREIVEDMLQIIEEGMLEELSFELLTIAIEDIHQDNQIAAGGQHEPMNIDSDSESIPFEYDEFEQHNNVLIITQMDSDDDGDDGDDENDDDDDDEDSDGWMEDDEGDDGDDDDDDDSDFELDAQELIYDELFNNLFEIEAFKRTYFGGYNPDNDDSDGSDSSDDGAANPPGHWQVELHQANAGPIIIQLPSGDSVGNIELEYGYYLDSDDED